MNIAIIITTPDFAGLNIKENLLADYEFTKTSEKWEDFSVWQFNSSQMNSSQKIKMYTTNKRCVVCEDIDKEIDADLFIFPTTHRSAANTNSLSCHTQGNWGKAELGGANNLLSIAPAIILKKMYKNLCSYKDDTDEQITLECTHHGPRLEKPTIFIEIGSEEKQWQRKDLGKIISDVIMKTIQSNTEPNPNSISTAIGLGGPHYCNNFNDIQELSDIAIGHICPKYMLENLDEKMIFQAINKTIPKPNLAILDWKGLGKEKGRIIEILERNKIKWKKTRELK